MAGRLNDNEVAQEMNKMVSFIKQEALEKAREIKIKADEEFNIEKAKIVRHETIAIEAFYQKKMKQAEVQRKIQQSNHVNKCRLRVLQARQQVLDSLMSEARKRLITIRQNQEQYKELLHNLILQSLFQLMESKITVTARADDIDTIQSLLPQIADAFTKETGTKVNLTVESGLSEDCAGGVVVGAHEGRIRVSSTLENRLELCGEQMLPDIRILLFGPSPNRKFYN
ncbi:putative vacuolar ATP synthase subunit E [Gaertneriomyces semiglobifer]|nr:putative vacuolar ATP synthase subunit E [Gaertneriomyces semiglobifer]